MQRPRSDEDKLLQEINSLVEGKRGSQVIKNHIKKVLDVTPGNLPKYFVRLREDERQLLRANAPAAVIKILDLFVEEPDQEPEQPARDDHDPTATGACTRAEFAEFRRDITDLIMQVSARAASASAPDPQMIITYTQDVQRWEAAHRAGCLHQLIDRWLAGTLPASSVGESGRQMLKLNLATAARDIRHAYSAAAEDPWKAVKPMIFHALALEAASEAYLRGGVKLEFITVAAEVLAAEEAKLWTGSPAAIRKGVDDIVKVVSANFLIPRGYMGGRPGPRRSRKAGANSSGDKRNQRNNPSPSPSAQRGPSA